MNKLRKILKDIIGLRDICGSSIALHWIFLVVANCRRIISSRNLQAADVALGSGPFQICIDRYSLEFKIFGSSAISGVREMYVRDVYFRNGLLRIFDGDLVLDLGANMGNFTNLALAHGSHVRVIAVEPSLSLNESFNKSIVLNSGFSARFSLLRAFLGSCNSSKVRAAMEDDENYAGVPWVGEEKIIQFGCLTTIDFLKCDIEGGEYSLFLSGSRLLEMTKSLAIEIHAFAGNPNELISIINSAGLSTINVDWANDGSCIALFRRCNSDTI